MPVFPAVDSTTRPPGFRSPRFSASRIIHLPARSLTDWPGFMNSALPRMVQPVSSEACLSLIRGVLPIAWMTSLWNFMLLEIRLFPRYGSVDASSKRHPAPSHVRMIYSENRGPLFRIMLSEPKGPPPRAQANGMARLLPGFCEHHLPHVDISRQESGLAVRQI